MAWLPETLQRFLRPAPSQPKEVLSLNREQAKAVMDLVQSPAWKHYSRALEEMAHRQGRVLLQGGLDYEQYLFQTGALRALKEVLRLPDYLSLFATRNPDDATNGKRHDAGPDHTLNTVWYTTPGTN